MADPALPPNWPFPSKPKWAQAPEVPKWQQAPLADGAGKGGKTVLTINGKRVSVSDNFLSMTPEEQNLAVDEIAGSMGMVSAATPAPRMLRFEIQTPDGKTYEVEAPDQEAALAAVKSMEGTATAPGYRAKADAQAAAIEAAQARRNAGSEPSAGTFTPQQQAAIEAARGRRSGRPIPASAGCHSRSILPPPRNPLRRVCSRVA